MHQQKEPVQQSQLPVHESEPDAPFKKWETPAYIMILALLVLIAYANSFNNAFVSDDTYGILNNPAVAQFQSVKSQMIRYLQPLLYFIISNTFGIVPFWFRLLNILAHIGTVSMMFVILSIISTPMVAFFAAAIFAVHPINIEAVSWISGGTYSWYTFFFLLSFFFYIKAFKNARTNWTSYVGSLLFYLQSLSVGVPAVVLCGIVTVYEYLYGKLSKRWPYLIPYFIFSAIFGLVAISGIGAREISFREDHYQVVTNYNPLLQIPVAISSYFELFVWPQGLTLYHSEMNFSTMQFAFKVTVLLMYVSALIISFFKSRPIFFGLSLFLIGLIPTLTPHSIHWVVAERYAYFSMIGVTFVTAYLLAKIPKKYEAVMFLTIIIMILGFTVRTVVRNNDWHNEDNLWIATGKTSPSDPKTHNNLGDVYTRQGNYAKAAEELIIAIKLNPNYADAYHNLGNVYQRAGQLDAALEMYGKALQINPRLWQAYQNIGALYFQQQQFASASASMRQAAQLNPGSAQIRAFVGIIEMNRGDKAAAAQYLQEALQLDPSLDIARQALGEVQKK